MHCGNGLELQPATRRGSNTARMGARRSRGKVTAAAHQQSSHRPGGEPRRGAGTWPSCLCWFCGGAGSALSGAARDHSTRAHACFRRRVWRSSIDSSWPCTTRMPCKRFTAWCVDTLDFRPARGASKACDTLRALRAPCVLRPPRPLCRSDCGPRHCQKQAAKPLHEILRKNAVCAHWCRQHTCLDAGLRERGAGDGSKESCFHCGCASRH